MVEVEGTDPNAPLLVLAFDQRGWLSSTLWGADPAAPIVGECARVLEDIKTLVAEGLLASPRPVGARAGVLVDPEFGEAALEAVSGVVGVETCVAIERNNRPVLELEDGWREQLGRFRPAYAKVLVWDNPGDDRASLNRQLEVLVQLSVELEERGQPWLLEVLQPPTDDQLASVDGDHERYDLMLRPRLLVETIERYRSAGVEPDLWKLEGHPDVAECRVLLDAVTEGARRPVNIVVLGRNGPDEQVDRWLEAAAQAGFAGFAVGRSIWWEAAKKWLDGDVEREQAVGMIAARYQRFCDVYLAAIR